MWKLPTVNLSAGKLPARFGGRGGESLPYLYRGSSLHAIALPSTVLIERIHFGLDDYGLLRGVMKLPPNPNLRHNFRPNQKIPKRLVL